MSKEEFLRILRIKISGAMSPSEVESQIDYYSAYIDGELMKGKSEGQIIEELGDPTLIAKTLTSAVRRADDGPEFYSNNEYSEDTSNEQKEKSNVFQIGKAGCIIGFLIALFIIILLIVLMVKFSFAIIRFLWPVIIILLVGGLIFGLLRRR